MGQDQETLLKEPITRRVVPKSHDMSNCVELSVGLLLQITERVVFVDCSSTEHCTLENLVIFPHLRFFAKPDIHNSWLQCIMSNSYSLTPVAFFVNNFWGVLLFKS